MEISVIEKNKQLNGIVTTSLADREHLIFN